LGNARPLRKLDLEITVNDAFPTAINHFTRRAHTETETVQQATHNNKHHQ